MDFISISSLHPGSIQKTFSSLSALFTSPPINHLPSLRRKGEQEEHGSSRQTFFVHYYPLLSVILFLPFRGGGDESGKGKRAEYLSIFMIRKFFCESTGAFYLSEPTDSMKKWGWEYGNLLHISLNTARTKKNRFIASHAECEGSASRPPWRHRQKVHCWLSPVHTIHLNIHTQIPCNLFPPDRRKLFFSITMTSFFLSLMQITTNDLTGENQAQAP